VSLRATRAVWKYSEQKGGTRLTLLALADVADEEGLAWPSVATLADMTRLTERAIRYALSELVASSEVEIVEQGGGRHRTTCYKIALLDAVSVQGLHPSDSETLQSLQPHEGENPAIRDTETLQSAPERGQSATPKPCNLRRKGCNLRPERGQSATGKGANFAPYPIKNDQLTAANGSRERGMGGIAAAAPFDVAKRSIAEHPRWDDLASYASCWADFNTAEGRWPEGFWTPEIVRLLEEAIDAFDFATMQRASEWGHERGGKPLQVVIATARKMAADLPPRGAGLRPSAETDPAARRAGEDFMAWLKRQRVVPAGAMRTGWRVAG
jgi:hypothetical protein